MLGVVQGLTEFLPVSSSGHIEIAREMLDLQVADNMQFTMLLHAGTVLSTIVVFWREIGRLFADLFRFRMNEGTVFVINLLIASLPVALIGLFFREQIEGLFAGNLLLVGCMLLVTAALLILSGRIRTKNRPVTPKSAFMIGVAQAAAVLPGLSRSGSTISAGLLQGIDRATVAKFSFLMALIPILGELVLDAGGLSANFTTPMLAGFVASFVMGLVACKWMIRLVSRGKLLYFAIYCIVVGLSTIIFTFVA